MLVKHKNIILDIPKDDNEPSEEYNKRVIFILKNMFVKTDYSFNDLLELSYIYKFKETTGCSYEDKIENIIKELSENLYLKL